MVIHCFVLLQRCTEYISYENMLIFCLLILYIVTTHLCTVLWIYSTTDLVRPLMLPRKSGLTQQMVFLWRLKCIEMYGLV